MQKKLISICLVVLVSLSFSACVTKQTFEMKEAEAKKYAESLSKLQEEYDALAKEKEALEADKSELIATKEELLQTNDSLNTNVIQLSQEKGDCQADNKQLEEILQAKSDSLSRTISELRDNSAQQKIRYESQITELKEEISVLTQEKIELQNQIAAELIRKEQEVSAMNKTYNDLIDKMKNEIDKKQVTITELEGKLTVNLVDAVLFDSGKAEVKEGGLIVLQKVVDILKDITGKEIRIEGHTDNVQIIGGLAKKYPTNWELSTARAVNVTRFLQQQGIDPANLAAVGYGEFKPVSDNDTPEGRTQNRRIEIILANKE